MSEDNIIVLDILRVERHKPRKCTCKVRRYTIDIVNRLVECECGMEHDAFEAIADLAYRHEELNRKQKQMNEQCKSWAKEKPHSAIFKNLERHYRKGEMLPHCPACDAMFDYKDIVSHTNSKFHKMLKAREAKRK